MTAGTTHVIGAGLAGLSAAVALTEAGRRVVVHESAPQAGGRCRSFDDPAIGCRIDNGNHLLLSGNTAALAYLRTIGAEATMGGPGEPFFPFHDLADGRSWTLRPNRGRLPWWVLSPARRVPGTTARDYLRLLPLTCAHGDATMAALLPRGPLRRDLLEPLAISALNTQPGAALARLMGAVMRETLMRGGAACIPLFPRATLAESLVDPALAWLRARGATVALSARIAALTVASGRLAAIGDTPLGPDDSAVLAVPAWAAADLLPDLTVPGAHEAILNTHFRAEAAQAPADIRRAGFVGLVGGFAEWAFLKPGHVSVTVSAANAHVDLPAETIAARIWPEVRAALNLAGPMPAYRVVKEKRATFAATAAQDARRPAARTPLPNLALAGDWTATGLPATIEGAIRSGRAAAEILLQRSA